MDIFHIAPNGKSSSSAAWRILRAQGLLGMRAVKLVFRNPGELGQTTFQSSKVSSTVYAVVSKLNSLLIKVSYIKIKSLPWSLNTFSPPSYLSSKMNKNNIINFHWLPSTTNSKQLKKTNIPVVLISHDVWNLTGGCHANLQCEGWKAECKMCPQVRSRFPMIISPHKTFLKKKNMFKSIERLGIVAPSNWIANMYRQSNMFLQRPIRVIPNPGNTEVFRKTDDYRGTLRIQTSENFFNIIFVVSGTLAAHHKGYDMFIEIIKKIEVFSDRQIQIILVGDHSGKKIQHSKFTITYYGKTESEEEMCGLLNLADLTISTSRQDNLPNNLVESILCGTPVISFDIGGISEIICDGQNGILIEPFKLDSFSRAISAYINDTVRVNSSSDEIAEAAKFRYSEHRAAIEYQKFYKELIEVRQ